MSIEQNKTTVRRYYDEVFNQRDAALVDELAVEDYVENNPFPGQGNGRNDLKARVQAILSAFSPMSFKVEQVVAEGDKVVVRWTQTATQSGNFMGVPPTGRDVTVSGIDVHLLRDGKMAEHWHAVDQLGLLQQLGVLPPPHSTES